MKPLFTIVIPSLNQSIFLEHALVSLFSQVDTDAEVIVVDGGSTDGSVGIIERFAAVYDGVRFGAGSVSDAACVLSGPAEGGSSRFLWCSEPDNGQSHALNKGFSLAKGEYLTWLNADDVLLPDALRQVKMFVDLQGGKTKAPWVVGNLVYIDSENRVVRCARDGRWYDLLYRNAPVRVYGPSSFFTRELYQKAGGRFDEGLRYAMDTDLWLRFKNLGYRFIRLPRYLWGFRVHSGSKTNGGELERLDEKRSEYERVHLDNQLQVKWYGAILQRFSRVISGMYLLSGVDTLRYRGKPVQCMFPSDDNR